MSLLGSVGVLAGGIKVLPDFVQREVKRLAIPDTDISPWLPPKTLASSGAAVLWGLSAQSRTPAEGLIEIRRFPEDGGEVLFQRRLGPYRHFYWQSQMGHEIWGPVRIVASEGVDANLFGMSPQGYMVAASRNSMVTIPPPERFPDVADSFSR